QPTMDPLKHPIAGVMNEMNAVYVYTNYSGPLMFFGKGAGSLPTASAVVSDLVYYGSRIYNQNKVFNNLFKKGIIIPTSETEEKFYLRFNTFDKPGVIAYIANVLGENQISISSVRQEETKKEPAEVILLTHKAKEKNVRKAIEEIDKNKDYILEPTIMMRIEELA
ncbi:MAG: ACT domain-containing protein, partial [Leptospiraceae bacterium]|nr:ACT domain-containing protein [Leptospiraceae bacterium]